VTMPALAYAKQGQMTTISHADVTARATPANHQPYAIAETSLFVESGELGLNLQPGSVNLAWFPTEA
jgi:hypothetical protein